MNLQINLLSKIERRYQGIVSMKVMVMGSVGVLVGITVLVFSLAGISRMTLNANLDRVRREWERINPLATVVRSDGYAATANLDALKKLREWSGSAVPVNAVLRAVQKETPGQMQLSSLFAGIEEREGAHCVLRMSGRVRGELAAVETKRKLNADSDVRSFCSEVRLISSYREQGELWSFALEGVRRVGEEL